MKTFIALIALTLAFTANATSLHPDTFARIAKLRTWDFDVDSNLRNLEVTGGELKINAVRKTAEIRFDYDFNCPPNAFCAAVMPEVRIQLPIVDIHVDGCNIVTYKAVRDMMPVDGVREELIIKDYSHSPCELLVVAPVTINHLVSFYDRLNAELVKRHSFYTADKLSSPFIRN